MRELGRFILLIEIIGSNPISSESGECSLIGKVSACGAEFCEFKSHRSPKRARLSPLARSARHGAGVAKRDAL